MYNRLLNFCRQIPKIELHAHLGGSIRRSTLKQISQQREIQYDNEQFEGELTLKKCFQIFDQIEKVITDKQSLKRITQEVLGDLKNENIVYAEIRTSLKQLQDCNPQEYIDLVLNEIQRANGEGNNIYRLIISINRANGLEQAKRTLNVIQNLVQSGNKLLVGVDYAGNPFKNDFKQYKDIFQIIRSLGLKITIHAGETKEQSTLNENDDILEFKPDRIGHFNASTIQQLNKIKELKLPIECCPTSNVCTMELKSIKDHHFLNFYQDGHPICICTDDTGLFNTNLAQELCIIAEAYNLNKQDIINLQKKTIDYIFDEEAKTKLQNIYQNLTEQSFK